jgi:hypothetical protein
MATWQFTIALVPRSWAVASDYNPENLQNEDGYDTSIAWANNAIPLNVFIQAFDEVLPRGKSWHKDLIAWGNENKTDIQLWQSSGVFDSAQIRLDLRDDPEVLLPRICEKLSELDCSCFIPEMALIVDPFPISLLEFTHRSRAATFPNDPDKFFKSLNQPGDRP